MAASPNFVNKPNVQATAFNNADGTAAKTVFTAGSAGSRVEAVVVTTNETANRQMTISMVQNAIAYELDRFTVASGTTAVPIRQYNVLNPERWGWLDPNNVGLIVPSGSLLQVNMEATITSGRKVNVFVVGGDF